MAFWSKKAADIAEKSYLKVKISKIRAKFGEDES